MRSVDRGLCRRASASLLLLCAGLLVSCGGSTTTSTTTICRDASVCVAQEVVQATPTGPNTTEIVVDSGGFSLVATNVPYVTVRVCSPGTTNCATIDRVILDTGSYGLRVLKSAVAAVPLSPVPIAADNAGTRAGNLAECYPFVIGAVWGPLVTADVLISGEKASNLPIQLIDDGSPVNPPVGPGCSPSPASNLQANGILGIGVVGVDCGLSCTSLPAPGMLNVYYSCPAGGGACTPAAVPSALQVQNPVPKFEKNNNGTMIVMPALPALGAVTAKGRLVFGIGTQLNNQLPATPSLYQLSVADPNSLEYLSVTVQVAGRSYVSSYIDSGANGTFFEAAGLPRVCAVNGGVQGEWYCPAATAHLAATMTDPAGIAAPANFDLPVANADQLFSGGGAAFANLGGSVGQGADTVALGMPFFYGRTVYTAIWGGSLSLNGPWYSF